MSTRAQREINSVKETTARARARRANTHVANRRDGIPSSSRRARARASSNPTRNLLALHPGGKFHMDRCPPRRHARRRHHLGTLYVDSPPPLMWKPRKNALTKGAGQLRQRHTKPRESKTRQTPGCVEEAPPASSKVHAALPRPQARKAELEPLLASLMRQHAHPSPARSNAPNSPKNGFSVTGGTGFLCTACTGCGLAQAGWHPVGYHAAVSRPRPKRYPTGWPACSPAKSPWRVKRSSTPTMIIHLEV